MPYLTKIKKSISSKVYSGKSTSLKTKYSTKGSDLSGISSISNALSNDCTSYLAVVECRKTTEEAKLIALQEKERAKRKKKLLKSKKCTYEIKKLKHRIVPNLRN